MCSLKHYVIKNGFFVPNGYVARHDTVYDKNSEIVEESCVLRGKNKSKNKTNPPQRLADAIKEKATYVDKRLLFMGRFMHRHYGHFLTEGISRYWYIMQATERRWKIPAPINPSDLHLNASEAQWRIVMTAFGLSAEDILYVSSPVQAREIIVPQCSMYNRHRVYMQHLNVTRKVAKDILGSSHLGGVSTPIYLSRTKLNKRIKTYFGEETVESHCREVGCKIVYPECLSLKEQIALFNTHDIFIGCVGSAFHTLLYRFVDRKAINVYLAAERPNPNYSLIDNLMHNESHYIRCAGPVQDVRKTFELDSKMAIGDIDKILGKYCW